MSSANCMYNGTSEERTEWDLAVCPLERLPSLRGCPLMHYCNNWSQFGHGKSEYRHNYTSSSCSQVARDQILKGVWLN